MATRFQKEKRHIARRLSLLKMGDDCHALLQKRSDTIFSALWIDEVKHSPTLREKFITAAANVTPFRDINAKVGSYLKEREEAQESASQAS